MRHISAQNFKFQYSSTFVRWLIKELLNIILAWQYHLVAGLGTEVSTQGRLPLPVPALGLAVPRGRHRPDKRTKLISTTINVNRINQSFKCAIKIIRVDTWNLNVSSFSFTSSTCWYDKVDQHRIYSRPPHISICDFMSLSPDTWRRWEWPGPGRGWPPVLSSARSLRLSLDQWSPPHTRENSQ